ncbi:FERM, ARHGEF and pleckstrin domain-containing protein 2 [Garra rufa]|uniref:FERM, ARHGEF and pleckstrin domain-containing protein 2 n=1 Tax=Garra rufa TaxID=137080 RepID=UPI003CCE7E5B
MGEIEGTYRSLQTPAGTRLGAQYNTGISTLEPGQSLSSAMGGGGKHHNKGLQIRVQGLDDAQEFYELDSKGDGQTLSSEVFRRINLIESDYFGLEFQNLQMNWVWLEPTKLIVKQVRRPMNTLFRLSVKFFPPDPGQLQEEFTRYLFSLQIKRDLIDGRMNCTENTAALLASHLVQCIGRTQKQLVEYVRDSGLRRTPYQRRNSKIRMSTRSLASDVLKQNLSFNDSLRCPIPPSSVTASFHSLHAPSSPMRTETPIQPVHLQQTQQPVRAPSPMQQDSIKTNPQSNYAFPDSATDSPQLSPFNTKGPLCLSPSFQMSTLSLPGQAPSPLQSPNLNEVGTARLEEDEEGRRKRYPTDKAYFIAKEILTTERTYLKDLEVITVWFRSAVIKENAMPEGLMTLLFSNIDPIYEFHRGFLKEIDQRLALWEGRSNAHVKGDYQRIGDVMLRNMCALKEFTGYLQKHDEVLTELEKATKRVKKLETVYKEFELQKVCYLPLNTFLLKPIQRLMHYKLILERLCKHYAPQHRDYDDCKEALKEVADIVTQLQSSLIRLENFQKLTELQRDLIGIENLTAPGREFIREGCLYKLTKKGLQQRMFFLFSDMLLYTSKGVTATNQFKVHGQLPLHGMILIVLDAPVEESENEWSVPHCFTIYSAQRTIVVAASSKVEMNKWIEDLNMAIDMSKKCQEKSDLLLDPSLCDRSNRSSDEVSLEQESEDDMNSSRCSLDKQSHHRANTTMHVCWHRNTSVSMSDHSLAVEVAFTHFSPAVSPELPPRYLLGQGQRPNTITHVCWYRNQNLSLSDYLRMNQNQLSGYLLRKFKNSNGWQKLWVVFTNFCLFFYKTHQDDFPLASLPLLGYTVSTPGESDSIHKEYVFKLQFKSHVYFFRAESEYTFERWMEVIKSAASSAGRMSLLVPKGPAEMNGGS